MSVGPVAEAVVTTDPTVGGMTRAACVKRAENKLGTPQGVTATVDPATRRARVSHPRRVGPGELVEMTNGVGTRG